MDKENLHDMDIIQFTEKIKNFNLEDIFRIIQYLSNVLNNQTNNILDYQTEFNDNLEHNKKYKIYKKEYEFNLLKLKTLEYLNNHSNTIHLYIPFNNFKEYLKFDNLINDYIRYLIEYYYDEKKDFYAQMGFFFNSLFLILETNMDILNYKETRENIKKEIDNLTDKILNFLTNLNILCNNKF